MLAEYDSSEVAWDKSEILLKTVDFINPTFIRRIQTGNIDKWNRLPLIEIPPGYALVARVDTIQPTQITDHESLHRLWLGYERWKQSNPSAGHWEDNHREQFVFGFNPASGVEELVMVDPDHLVKPANM